MESPKEQFALMQIRETDRAPFLAERDPRGFYIHKYQTAEILTTDTLVTGARHLSALYKQEAKPRHILMISPNIRQVGTHLGPQLFTYTGHMFASCAWILPDKLPMIVAKEVTRHIRGLFPFDVFRYRKDAEDWLLHQIRPDY